MRYTAWPNPMIRSPASSSGADHRVDALGGADLVDQVQRPARRTAVQRAAQRTDRRDHAGADVGTGRGDDPRRERRGVEAVVDRRDRGTARPPGPVPPSAHVPSSSTGSSPRTPRSGRGATGCRPERSRCRAHSSVGTTAHRRSASARRSSGLRSITGRSRCPLPHSDQCAAQAVERLGDGGDGRQQPSDCVGDLPGGADLGGEAPARLRVRWQHAVEHQLPHLLQRALLGEPRRRTAAVVVEALLATHVADPRLGDDHALQSTWGLDGPVHQHRHAPSVRPLAAIINVDYDQCDVINVDGRAGRRSPGDQGAVAVRVRQPRPRRTTHLGRRAQHVRGGGDQPTGQSRPPAAQQPGVVDPPADRDRADPHRLAPRQLPRPRRRRTGGQPHVRAGRRAAVARSVGRRARAVGVDAGGHRRDPR